MHKLLFSLFVLLAISACETGGSFNAGARGSHAIMIMVEDGDAGSIPRDNRVSRRVLDEFSNQISSYGFSVFDETALTFKRNRQGRSRRSDAELIDIVRSIKRPPINTIALFTIYTDSQLSPHTRKLRVRMSARLLDAQSGRRLGNFEVSDEGNVNPNCSGPCYAETVGGIAKILGGEVADVLSQKLDVRFSPGRQRSTDDGLVRGLTLTFDNFSVVEMQDIQGYLEIFSGYRSHRPINSFRRHAEIWYESSIVHFKLRQNLDRMFEELRIKARIAFQGDAYNIRQIEVPVRTRRKAPSYKW
jgi:hypothetical protein